MNRRNIVSAFLGSTATAAAATLPASDPAVSTNDTPRFARTATEIAAGVMPRNVSAQNGPTRYGAMGDGTADDTAAWMSTGKVNGYHFVYDGSYRITSKIQTSAFVTLVGATRQNTILRSAGFSDYLLEVGAASHGPNPNVGSLQRLRFFGTIANAGLLHMNQLSHMWRLDDLAFSSSPCPALVVDNCWDSNYTNIDILACGSPKGTDPAVSAMVIVKNGANNIYFRGLRMEHAPVGVLYIGRDCSPIYVATGKIDQGGIPQKAPAVSVAEGAVLVMSDFNLTGIAGQYAFDVAGSLLLNNVSVYGGSGMPAINDVRAWVHVDGLSRPGAAGPSFGPVLSNMTLGSSQFYRSNMSVNGESTSVIRSKIFPIRLVERVSVTGSAEPRGDSVLIQTDAKQRANNCLDNCYLVHNPTGTQAAGEAGSRRKIVTSFSNGQLLLHGNWPCTADSEWSVEFCGGHFTPNLATNGIQLERGMTLFSVIAEGIRIRDTPKFNATNSTTAPGSTIFTVDTNGPIARMDVVGYFLVDDRTAEPFYISHGVDSAGRIAVMYDRTHALSASSAYSIVAGYVPNVQQTGGSYEWSYAGKPKSISVSRAHHFGFDFGNLPLWGIGSTI